MKIKKCTPPPAHRPSTITATRPLISSAGITCWEDTGCCLSSVWDAATLLLRWGICPSCKQLSYAWKPITQGVCSCRLSCLHSIRTPQVGDTEQPWLGCILLTGEADGCWSQSISPPTWVLDFKPWLESRARPRPFMRS